MLAIIGCILIFIGGVLSVLRPRPPAAATPLIVVGLALLAVELFK
jgi:hypothetical protein